TVQLAYIIFRGTRFKSTLLLEGEDALSLLGILKFEARLHLVSFDNSGPFLWQVRWWTWIGLWGGNRRLWSGRTRTGTLGLDEGSHQDDSQPNKQSKFSL